MMEVDPKITQWCCTELRAMEIICTDTILCVDDLNSVKSQVIRA
jgi:hypothetical protein